VQVVVEDQEYHDHAGDVFHIFEAGSASVTITSRQEPISDDSM